VRRNDHLDRSAHLGGDAEWREVGQQLEHRRGQGVEEASEAVRIAVLEQVDHRSRLRPDIGSPTRQLDQRIGRLSVDRVELGEQPLAVVARRQAGDERAGDHALVELGHLVRLEDRLLVVEARRG
jgi:hypothetical protein